MPDDYPYGRFGVFQRDRYVVFSDQALSSFYYASS
jgi:hypothetical protein